MNRLAQDISVVGIKRGDEKYVVLFEADDQEQKAEALRVLGRWAANPELKFTWYDAAVASQTIRGKK